MGGEIKRVPGVAYTLVLVGDDERRTANLARVFVKLVDIDARTRGQFEIMDQVRCEVLPAFAAEKLRSSVSQVAAIGGGGMTNKEVAFFVSGPDLRKLGEAAGKLTAALDRTPAAVDVDTTLVLGKPELSVRLDRAKAAELGVQVADVADTLGIMIGGWQVSTYNGSGEQYEVHARAHASRRTDAASLMQIAVPSAKLGAVSLDNVARIEESEGPSQVDRLGRRRMVTISANIRSGHSQAEALAALEAEVRALRLDGSYTWGSTGTSKEMGQAARNFVLAFALSIVFMYLVLAAQFESWLHPVTILLTLPLTVPFALVSIVLFGVVKKNAILQIDHTLALRAQGVPRLEAILRANRDRLRPILVTTLAFVAGMIPLLLARGVGAGDNRAIGAVIAGGQTLSLLLTLLATPVFYSLFDDAGAWLAARVRQGFRPARRIAHAGLPEAQQP